MLDSERIDWILTTPDIVTSYAAVDTSEQDGRFPSDHLPVRAVLRLPAAPPQAGARARAVAPGRAAARDSRRRRTS